MRKETQEKAHAKKYTEILPQKGIPDRNSGVHVIFCRMLIDLEQISNPVQFYFR